MTSRLRRTLAAAVIALTGLAGVAQATVINLDARNRDAGVTASVAYDTDSGKVRGRFEIADQAQDVRADGPGTDAIDAIDLGGDRPPVPPIGPGVHCGVTENPLCVIGLDLGGPPPIPVPIGPGVHCGVTENPLCVIGLDLGGPPPIPVPIGPGVHCGIVESPLCNGEADLDVRAVDRAIATATALCGDKCGARTIAPTQLPTP